MTLTDAVALLQAHNTWRRTPAHMPDDASPPMGSPTQLGIAIDTVVDTAPLVLAALVKLRAVCTAMDLETESARPSEAEYAAAMAQAEAAIINATGEVA
jgi:hypothetical protein